MATESQVVEHYYDLYAKQGGRKPVATRIGDQVTAGKYLAWAQKQQIDPLGFIDFLFQRFVPEIYRLRNNAMAEQYRKWGQDKQEEQKNLAEQSRRLHAPLEDQHYKDMLVLTVGMEAMKHPYVTTGRHHLCLAEFELTGGYHPSSRYCTTCPLAVECSAQLYQAYGFDVVSLRAGRYWAVPQEVVSRALR